MFVTLDVLMPVRSTDLRFGQTANRYAMFLTFDVLSPARLAVSRDVAELNIPPMSFTSDVSNFVRSIVFSDEQFANIAFIVVIPVVLIWLRSIDSVLAIPLKIS